MSHPFTFTGQNLLAGFALQLSDLLWLNEVTRRDPYQLYHASRYNPSDTNSGFSFGALQWDIPNHTPLPGAVQAREIFLNILRNATDASGKRIINDQTLQVIEPLIDIKGNPYLLDSYLNVINAALDSAYGRQQIDANHVNEINLIVGWVSDTVALVTDSTDNAYLVNSEVARLFIGDLRNQYSYRANDPLRLFLQGNQNVNITIGGKTATVSKVGRLGMDDILNFYFAVPGNAGPADKLRRFNGIISVRRSSCP
jgi:hypothetical protein